MLWLKSFLAIVVSAIGALVTALGTSPQQSLSSLDLHTWIVAIVSVLGSGGLVYAVQNLPGIAGGVAKAVLAFLSAGFASLVVALDDKVLTQAEWLTALGAAVVATGVVYQATNGVRLTGART